MANNPYSPGRPKRWKRGETKVPPRTAGEYRLVDKTTGAPLYIGETSDVQRRLTQHTRPAQRPTRTDKSNRFDPSKHRVEFKAAKLGATTGDRRAHERSKIVQHKPPWNRDGGGSGRKTTKRR